MEAKNYFSRTVGYFRGFRTKKETTKITNELIHPRFGVSATTGKNEKNPADSLTFLMYSQENENLFI